MAAEQENGATATPSPSSGTSFMRVRHRRRGADSVPEVVTAEPALPACEAASEAVALCEPDAARLRLVLIRVMQGRTQEEIAEEFDVTDRTIRNWIAEAKRRRIAAFKSIDPEEMLARTDHLHAVLRGTLLRRLESAEKAGDDRALEACCRELRGIERDRYNIRQTIGYFDGWSFYRAASDEAPGQRGAALLVAAISEVFGPQSAAPDDEGRAAAGHDDEPLIEQ